ncbi:BatD family protein [Solilutibacter silvestris]|uniref:Oxygen tolerance-related protein BatD n=1 Tax=Solilutibacter silvestris TaxID=1645665 RepID=A0A2K1PXF1_9GAMM|nr:BatD family protein [Lysobacter silvestris]PNS07357.1 Oxygen tolerance-related protein BatD [Lysobacter silvestris]
MRHLVAVIALWLLVAPAWARTSATLDRTQVTQGEAVVLTIATDQVGAPDYSALQSRFRMQGVSSERSVHFANGSLSVDLRYRVRLLALQAGVQTIPALAVGHDRTQPLQLEVIANTAASSSPGDLQQSQSEPAATGQGPVFIQAQVDDRHPYVQQAVGIVVRLFYATQMVDGALDLEAPSGASLRRVGEDVQGTQDIAGRTYSVIERHYILVPDRRGTLTLPAAHFSGHGQGGFIDDVFGDGRENLRANGQPQALQVRATPANAAQPWLPLHRLDVQALAAPNSATAGQTTVVTLRAQADGANAAQLPELMLTADNDAQVYPEAPTVEDRDDHGRPQTVVTRRFSVVPAHPGALQLRATPIQWWNVVTDQAATAETQALTLNVAPGSGAFAVPTAADAAASPSETRWPRWLHSGFVWSIVAAVFGLLWIVTLALLSRRRHVPADATRAPQAEAPSPNPAPLRNDDLQEALKSDDLARIAHALQRMVNPPAADLDALKTRLGSTQQVEAIESLQAALWGNGRVAPDAALASLRQAFRDGPRWSASAATENAESLLPPLYPER